jgi:hypothetical protein
LAHFAGNVASPIPTPLAHFACNVNSPTPTPATPSTGNIATQAAKTEQPQRWCQSPKNDDLLPFTAAAMTTPSFAGPVKADSQISRQLPSKSADLML